MKKLLSIVLMAIFFLLPTYAIKKIDANPINVAYMLAQESDTVKMAYTCHYYGYQLEYFQDGYAIYKHPKGAVIRYSLRDISEIQPYPKVEVKSDLSTKEIDKILIDLQFRKEGSSYIRKISQYARTVFNCTKGSQGFLIFHKTKVSQQK